MRLVQVAAALVLAMLANSSQAQIRPSDEPLELPEFVPEEREPSLLPPVPMPRDEERDRLSTGQRIVVTHFEVRGSTVFGEEELTQITAPYEGRELDIADLGLLGNAITALYVNAGYVTSGAAIPDQTMTDGVIVIEVIEGTLDKIVIDGNERLSSRYLRGRIQRGVGTPVNVFELEEQLQLLQQKELVRSIDAQLDPGARRGEGTLVVQVNEDLRVRGSVGAANDQSPAVGGTSGNFQLRHLSLTRNGDVLSGRGAFTNGYIDLGLDYSLPVNSHDTTLILNYRYTTAQVVESPFDVLDIESDAFTVGIGLRHPLIQSLTQELWLGLMAEYRESETDWAFGDFPFTPGSNDGEISISVLRFLQEWTRRAPDRVMAARSSVSLGIDALGSTSNGGSDPNSRFVAWLLQLQLVQQLPERFWDTQIVLRGDLQLANDPLLSLERYSLGGLRSVRGYRENELVRDNGYSTSIELRVPLFREFIPRGRLEIAPFVDFGQAWDEQHNIDTTTLSGGGVGLRYQIPGRLLAEVFWGGRISSRDRPGDDLQDDGVHFAVEVALW